MEIGLQANKKADTFVSKVELRRTYYSKSPTSRLFLF